MESTSAGWSFWLRLPEGGKVPTYPQVQEAVRRALPGFTVDFAVEEVGQGNPRDGYLHGVTCVASNGRMTLLGDVGLFGTFTPELDETARYEIYSFAPRVGGAAPWDEQEMVWHAVADAFAALGMKDATLESNTIRDSLLTHLRSIGEHAVIARFTQ